MVTTPALLAGAQPTEEETIAVRLSPLAESGVNGNASLTAIGSATRVAIEADGLTPNSSYVSRLHSGTCEQPSASFAALPSLDAGADGRGMAEGWVRFRESIDVPIADLADGDHVIVIADSASIVACGSIPAVSAGGNDTVHQVAEAVLHDTQGQTIGEVSLAQMDGRVLVAAAVFGLPPGFHGFHVHAVGACDPGTGFASAGGHLNPTGESHPAHAGDQPSLLVLEDGAGLLSFWTDRYTIDELMDDDGSTFIIHALPDNFANIPDRYAPGGADEMTHSTGDAGGRLACGVIEA
jgi:Cu-Zn family superoxide dismutase